MKNKICPLLSACDAESNHYCEEGRCAWYVPHMKYTLVEGRCAFQMLGEAMPELVKAVNEI